MSHEKAVMEPSLGPSSEIISPYLFAFPSDSDQQYLPSTTTNEAPYTGAVLGSIGRLSRASIYSVGGASNVYVFQTTHEHKKTKS